MPASPHNLTLSRFIQSSEKIPSRAMNLFWLSWKWIYMTYILSFLSALKVGLGRYTPSLVTLDGLDVFTSFASTITFPDLIGGGERTDVYRNKEMGLIAKVYAISERDTFRTESRLLRKANDISPRPTPRFFGCYESNVTGKAILIMEDVGDPVQSLTDLPPSQRYDVLP
jgi:hypothetical protein